VLLLGGPAALLLASLAGYALTAPHCARWRSCGAASAASSPTPAMSCAAR
jgi:hypothetical protein